MRKSLVQHGGRIYRLFQMLAIRTQLSDVIKMIMCHKHCLKGIHT